MRNVVSSEQMKMIDRYTIDDIGIPSLVLMERAALSVCEKVRNDFSKTDSICILCGTGNNGADGIAVGRILHLQGYNVQLITTGKSTHATKEYMTQLDIAHKAGTKITDAKDFNNSSCDLFIDALFGVGLCRDIEGDYADIIEKFKQIQKRYTISVDIPSGINGSNGHIMGTAIKADATVTFGYEKLGLMLYPGKEYSGEVIVSDIGFFSKDDEVVRSAFTLDKSDLAEIPQRPDYSHKGSFGKVLVIAGSENMCGAAFMSAAAAYRTGAGLVKIITPKANLVPIHALLPEAVLIPYETAVIEEECSAADAVVLGPGLGQEEYVKELVESVMRCLKCPLIIDADALNTIAQYPKLTKLFNKNHIITPHLGEMARLTGKNISDIEADSIETARQYSAKYNITCVLKSAATIVSDTDDVYINSSGNSSLAKAGSGDVLTGIIAGLIAIGMPQKKAAVYGAYIHGLSGEAAGKKHGKHSVMARDIIDEIGGVMSDER